MWSCVTQRPQRSGLQSRGGGVVLRLDKRLRDFKIWIKNPVLKTHCTLYVYTHISDYDKISNSNFVLFKLEALNPLQVCF